MYIYIYTLSYRAVNPNARQLDMYINTNTHKHTRTHAHTHLIVQGGQPESETAGHARLILF